MGQPTTQVVQTPQPAPQYPGLSQSYINALTQSGLAGTAAGTLQSAAAGTLPFQTTPQVQAIEQALKTFQQQGAANLKEQFGAGGLRSSSDIDKASALYETQSSAQMGDILAQYQEAQQAQQIGAAQASLGALQGPATATYAPGTLVTGPSPLQQIFSGIGAGGAALLGLNSLFPNLLGGFGGAGGGGGTSIIPATTQAPMMGGPSSYPGGIQGTGAFGNPPTGYIWPPSSINTNLLGIGGP